MDPLQELFFAVVRFKPHLRRTCSTAAALGACSWREDSVSCHTEWSPHDKYKPHTYLTSHPTSLRSLALGPREGSLRGMQALYATGLSKCLILSPIEAKMNCTLAGPTALLQDGV